MKNKNAYIIFFALWTALSVYFVFPFILPLMIGVIFTSIIYPLFKKSERMVHGRKTRAIIFSVIFTIIFLAPFVFIGVKATTTAMSEASQMQDVNWKNPDSEITKMIVQHPLANKLSEMTSFSREQIQGLVKEGVTLSRNYLTTMASGIISSIPSFIISLIVIIGTIYFCLTDGHKVLRFLKDNPFFNEDDTEFFFESFADVSFSVVVSSIFCAVVQALVYMIPAFFLDLDQVVIIGVFTFIFSFIPNIGTAPISFFLVGRAVFQDNWTHAIVYLIFGIIVAFSDNVVNAVFVGNRVNIHPFIVFLSAIGGIITLGVYGLFIAPVVILTLFKVYEYWNNKPDRLKQKELSGRKRS